VPMVFSSALTLQTSILVVVLQFRFTLVLRFGYKALVLHLLHFYEAYCILAIRYYHVTGGRLRFQL